MQIDEISGCIPHQLADVLRKEKITELRPAQVKAINNGLLDGRNLLVCTPTASGKTLIAELAALKAILEHNGKAMYLVPLVALAQEKYKAFKHKYAGLAKVALSVGNMDSTDNKLADYDLIIATAEKMDSLLRHKTSWIHDVTTIIVDEIHLINDPHRGPTVEVLLTMLRQLLKNVQIIGLSATIGNPEALAQWLDANLVIDDWRPVKLHKGVYYNGAVEFEG